MSTKNRTEESQTMITKHTPGPWPPLGAFTECGELVAHYRGDRNSYAIKFAEESVANARLIAAAPDLLAALIDAENMLDQLRHTRALDNETWDAIDKTVDAARAALAKAEGDWDPDVALKRVARAAGMTPEQYKDHLAAIAKAEGQS